MAHNDCSCTILVVRKCAWLRKHCICMLDVNSRAFYRTNEVDILCADMPEFRAKQDKISEIEGHKFKPPARNMCSCIRNRKWAPLKHLLQMPGLQKSLLLSSRRHKQHLVYYCLPMAKCETQSQDYLFNLLNKRSGPLKIKLSCPHF